LYVCVCFNKRVKATKPTRLRGVRESPLKRIDPSTSRGALAVWGGGEERKNSKEWRGKEEREIGFPRINQSISTTSHREKKQTR